MLCCVVMAAVVAIAFFELHKSLFGIYVIWWMRCMFSLAVIAAVVVAIASFELHK